MQPLVVFATPTLERRLCIEFVQSSLETQRALIAAEIAHAYLFEGGDCFLWKVRNKLLTRAMREFPDMTDLFFIDDDGSFPAAKVLEFIARPEPVVAGIYPKKSDDLDFPVRLLAGQDSRALIRHDGLVAADAVGMAFIRIKRAALQILVDNNGTFRETLDGPQYHHVFAEGVGDDGLAWGEDYVFCRKWLALGGDIWVDPDIELTHRGTKAWRARLSDHLTVFEEKAAA
jgi:hypothetical protein